MFAIYKKELRSAFYSFVAPALIAFILLFSGFFVSLNSLFNLASSIETSYSNTLFVLLIAVPVLSMRALAQERGTGTQILISSLPIKQSRVILGKYFAMVTIIALPLVLTFFYTFILGLYGNVNYISSFAATVAFILCGAAMLSIGLFISSLTDSAIVAAVITFACLLVIYFLPTIVLMLPATSFASFVIITVLIVAFGLIAGYLTSNRIACGAVIAILESVLIAIFCINDELLEGAAASLVSFLSLTDRFSSFSTYGVFDISSVIYYLSVSAVFVFLSCQSVERKRWN